MQLEVPQITPASVEARYFYASRKTPTGQLCLLTMAAHEDMFQAYLKAGDKVSQAYGLPKLKAFKFVFDQKGRVSNIFLYKFENDMHPEAVQRLHPDLVPVQGIRVKALRYPSKSKQAKGLHKLVGAIEQYENFQTYLVMKLAEAAGMEVTGDLLRYLVGTAPCADGSLAVVVNAAWKQHIELLTKSGFEEIGEQDFNKLRAEALDVGEAELVSRAKAAVDQVRQELSENT